MKKKHLVHSAILIASTISFPIIASANNGGSVGGDATVKTDIQGGVVTSAVGGGGVLNAAIGKDNTAN